MACGRIYRFDLLDALRTETVKTAERFTDDAARGKEKVQEGVRRAAKCMCCTWLRGRESGHAFARSRASKWAIFWKAR